MDLKSIICVIILAISTCSIGIPVDSQQDRCMTVFADNSDQYLKIDIKFPSFHAQAQDEYYRIQLINTQTHNIQDYNITSGTLRKQIQLTENVIYKLCVRIIIKSSRPTQVQEYIEYNSVMHHGGNAYEDNIKLPQNLLKIADLNKAYSSLLRLKGINQEVIAQASNYKVIQDYLFQEQQKKIKQIQWITIFECVAICVFGCYQYFRLKHVIQNKQNN